MEAGLSGMGSGSEVWEAAGILFVVVGNRKNGVVELVVAELLKGHGGSDGGENGDVWKRSTSSSSEHTADDAAFTLLWNYCNYGTTTRFLFIQPPNESTFVFLAKYIINALNHLHIILQNPKEQNKHFRQHQL